jgi:hypothetical protein
LATATSRSVTVRPSTSWNKSRRTRRNT